MPDSTQESGRIMEAAGRSLAQQRSGGTHRSIGSIGEGSARLKRSNRMTRIKLILGTLFAILVAASAAGLVLGGIGFSGVMITALAMIVALVVFSNYPRVKAPRRADLNRGDVKQLVGRTELWLEQQRPALRKLNGKQNVHCVFDAPRT